MDDNLQEIEAGHILSRYAQMCEHYAVLKYLAKDHELIEEIAGKLIQYEDEMLRRMRTLKVR